MNPNYTDKECLEIKAVLAMPGFALIQKLAEERIARAKLLALTCGEEAKFVELYRKAHAASNALIEFVSDLTALAEPQESE